MSREKSGTLAVLRTVGPTYLTWCVIHTLGRSVFEPIAKPSHAEASALRKVLGNLRKIFRKQVKSSSYLMSLYHSVLIGY